MALNILNLYLTARNPFFAICKISLYFTYFLSSVSQVSSLIDVILLIPFFFNITRKEARKCKQNVYPNDATRLKAIGDWSQEDT